MVTPPRTEPIPINERVWVNDTIRWLLRISGGVVLGLNLGLWIGTPFVFNNIQDREQRFINFAVHGWLSFSGLLLAAGGGVLIHDDRIVKKQKLQAESLENHTYAVQENWAKQQIAASFIEMVIAKASGHLQQRFQPEPVMVSAETNSSTNAYRELVGNPPHLLTANSPQVSQHNLGTERLVLSGVEGSRSADFQSFQQQANNSVENQQPNFQSFQQQANNPVGPQQKEQPGLIPTGGDAKIKALWDLISQPQNDWIKKLLLCKPLLIWGESGSGKTEIAKFLAMLRVLLFKHTIRVTDPQAHDNHWFNWDVVGHEYNYSAIDKELVNYYQRLKTNTQPITSIFDEVTAYGENCNPKLIGGFLISVCKDVRKRPEFPILLAHDKILSALGASKGATMRDDGMVIIHIRSARSELGEIIPLFKGTITGLFKNEKGESIDIPIEIDPSWMNADWLLEQFPELNGEQPLSESRNEQQQQEEFIDQSSGINLNKAFPDLSTEQAKLLTYLVRKSEELDTIEFRLSTIMNGNVINLEKFPWDESILIAARKPRLAYYICLRAIESCGYLKIIEDDKGVVIRLE